MTCNCASFSNLCPSRPASLSSGSITCAKRAESLAHPPPDGKEPARAGRSFLLRAQSLAHLPFEHGWRRAPPRQKEAACVCGGLRTKARDFLELQGLDEGAPPRPNGPNACARAEVPQGCARDRGRSLCEFKTLPISRLAHRRQRASIARTAKPSVCALRCPGAARASRSCLPRLRGMAARPPIVRWPATCTRALKCREAARASRSPASSASFVA